MESASTVNVITPEQLLQLRIFILESHFKCDNTHRLTKAWLASHGLMFDGETIERIQDCGGLCCDCEIGWNFPDNLADLNQRLEYMRKRRDKPPRAVRHRTRLRKRRA